MSMWSWIPLVSVQKLVDARKAIAEHVEREEAARGAIESLEREVADLKARLSAKEDARDILKERLEKRDEEYQALHVRYLALVDRQAAVTAERLSHRLPPGEPPRPQVLPHHLRSVPVHPKESDLPTPPTTEEVEARFSGE